MKRFADLVASALVCLTLPMSLEAHAQDRSAQPMIAVSLGAPTNTVYTRLYHARREFRRAYERELKKEAER